MFFACFFSSCTSFSRFSSSRRSRPNSTTKGFPSPRYPWTSCKAFWAVSLSAKGKQIYRIKVGHCCLICYRPSWPTWLQRRNHSPGRVMKAWPFILPVSSRYRTGGPFSCSNLENSATSWATDACALRFFTHNTYSETKQTNRSSISTRKCLVEMVMWQSTCSKSTALLNLFPRGRYFIPRSHCVSTVGRVCRRKIKYLASICSFVWGIFSLADGR